MSTPNSESKISQKKQRTYFNSLLVRYWYKLITNENVIKISPTSTTPSQRQRLHAKPVSVVPKAPPTNR